MHDCYKFYFGYDQCLHAICNQHLLRELQFLWEVQNQAWAKELSDKVISLQAEDGSWHNTQSSEWMENDNVLVSGLTRGYPGIYQVNISVPQVPAGDNVSLQVQAGGFTSPNTTTIAVQ